MSRVLTGLTITIPGLKQDPTTNLRHDSDHVTVGAHHDRWHDVGGEVLVARVMGHVLVDVPDCGWGVK